MRGVGGIEGAAPLSWSKHTGRGCLRAALEPAAILQLHDAECCCVMLCTLCHAVQFEGLDKDLAQSPYGASIPIDTALGLHGDVLLVRAACAAPAGLWRCE